MLSERRNPVTCNDRVGWIGNDVLTVIVTGLAGGDQTCFLKVDFGEAENGEAVLLWLTPLDTVTGVDVRFTSPAFCALEGSLYAGILLFKLSAYSLNSLGVDSGTLLN